MQVNNYKRTGLFTSLGVVCNNIMKRNKHSGVLNRSREKSARTDDKKISKIESIQIKRNWQLKENSLFIFD